MTDGLIVASWREINSAAPLREIDFWAKKNW
jgi:hypothetical protein